MSTTSLSGIMDAAPIVLLIALGALLRITGLVTGEQRLVLTKLSYYVTIPAAIFTSIARSEMTPSMLFLPLIGLVLPIVLAGVAYRCTRGMADRPEARGVLLAGMVLLGVFGYGFFEVFYGHDGLARMAMYDVGNSIFAGTVALWLAQRFGQSDGQDAKGVSGMVKVLTSPVMWAAVLGVAVSLLAWPVTGPIGGLLDRLTGANTPLAMIAVGTFLRPRLGDAKLTLLYLTIRMGLGGLLGWALSLALGMGGLDLVIATCASTLPMGTTTLIYAGNEGLDAELAASLISVSVIVGAVIINVLPHLLASVYL